MVKTLNKIRYTQHNSLLLLLLFTFVTLAGCTFQGSNQEDEEKISYNSRWLGKGWHKGEEKRRDIKQSHLFHTRDADLKCVDCHTTAQTEDKPGMPDMDICTDCHVRDTDDELPDKKGCLKCHTFKEPNPNCTIDHCAEDDFPEFETNMGPEPYKNIRYPTAKNPSGFSHRIHYENKVECKKCHGDIAKEGQIPFPTGKFMPKPERCFDCHKKNLGGFSHKVHVDQNIDCLMCHVGIDQNNEFRFDGEKYIPQGSVNSTPKECRKCHKNPIAFVASGDLDCKKCHKPNTFDNKIKPDYHGANWIELHGRGGRVAFNEKGIHGKDCYTCHKKVDCIRCHNTQRPKDHTNFWRNRGHGFMAEGNRERCLKCHRQDYCVRCHNETAPRSHKGNWRKRHCTFGCHLGENLVPEANCIVCHKKAPHTTAAHAIKNLNCPECHTN